MSRIVSLLTGFMFACAAGIAAANCACQCIEGVARTLCTTLGEAQANPSACGAGEHKVACDAAPPVTEPLQRYQPPEGAVDCRGARLWDPHTHSYAVVAKVCDLDRDLQAE
jgi:hypothetical protein